MAPTGALSRGEFQAARTAGLVGRYLEDFVQERIAKYRELGAQARNAALNAKAQEAIDMYMAMAAAWEHLAVELQHLNDMAPNGKVLEADPLSRTIMRRQK